MRALVLGLLTACAQATTGGGGQDIDASTGGGKLDGGRTIDARPPDASMVSCTSSATCQGAMDVGTVSGDTGGGMLSGNGYQSGWFRARITEDDSSVVGSKLKVTINLTSPASANYDLYAYVNTGSDVVECTTVSSMSTQASGVDTVHLSWGEGTISNGNDDSRYVSIEVRPAQGAACSAGSPYQLQITGNQ